ncbi:MAG: N-acetylmuramoyl-L-alanine amidase [Chloroflexota bacterium]
MNGDGKARRRLLKAAAATLGLIGGVTASRVRAADDGVVPIFRPPVRPSGAIVPPRLVAAEIPPFVRPREAWNAAPQAQPYVAHTPARVSVHHTGSAYSGRPGPEQYLRNIQTFHVGPEREWEDIAYHFLVDLDGVVWAGRPATVRGNPSRFYDAMGYVLICLLGDYGTQQPTEAQLSSVCQTAAWVFKQYSLPDLPVTGHRDHVSTACPGDNVYRYIQDGSITRRTRSLLG